MTVQARRYSGVDSKFTSGVQLAPTAGTAIVSLSGLAAGTYELRGVLMFLGGAPAGAEQNNWQVEHGTTNAGLLNCPTALNVPMPFVIPRVTIAASETLSIQAAGNATGGVTYAATLIATQVA